MNNRNAIIIAAIIIVVAIAASMIILNYDTAKETNIEIVSNTSLYDGDTISLKLTDEDGKPVAGENITLKFKDSKGWTNEVEVRTNDQGTADYTVSSMEPGNYTLECVYSGSDDHKNSNATLTVTILEEVSQTVSTTSSQTHDSGAFYSPQAGRVVHTGDVEYAPDGNYWIHKGNNEWEKLE
ncbi:MAG: carboxypeptidase-like regulatory domain-containing protein [Methanobrevibacter sp.]|uniref:carboxypeptidase-like regulatory domain-containing protein n=1 Tax=Methanobrevibacter sp. TaxID=66852 RepID=UPI0026E088E9|nr:carboxypeptidase-like regulatory domain-containing protein [Methanobrevibacter sp.]MDO5849066.1 carboxypeptidase-like regulatory domain-containing protein [Methanobrevibacter sp.]